MRSRLLLLAALFVVVTAPSGAEPPPTNDDSAQAAESPTVSETESSNGEQEWTRIISENGPEGVERIGKRLTVCGDVRLDPHSRKLLPAPGGGVVASLSKQPHNLFSTQRFGDCEVHLEFCIGKGSNSGVKLQGRYEIQLYDSHHKDQPTARECGGVYPHWVVRGDGRGLKYIDEGVPPLKNAAKPAGEWQSLRILFQAPRFNDQNEKTANARFKLVELNGQAVQRAVEVDSPTGNASTPLPEVAKGRLMLQLDHGAVAFRNVSVKPLD